MTQARRFRELLQRDGMVTAPGAYDESIRICGVSGWRDNLAR